MLQCTAGTIKPALTLNCKGKAPRMGMKGERGEENQDAATPQEGSKEHRGKERNSRTSNGHKTKPTVQTHAMA